MAIPVSYNLRSVAARWKTAGSRAFRLRQILLTLDIRKVTSPDFTNWSPIIETNYEELGDLIGVARAVMEDVDQSTLQEVIVGLHVIRGRAVESGGHVL